MLLIPRTVLLAEKASPIADVVFGLNAIIWESLKAENILIPFVPEWADEIPAGLNDDEGYYHAIVKQAILLVYDQNQLTEDQAPTDWPDCGPSLSSIRSTST